jgi:asparagine synthase (glutamine-hydrolysing)
LGKKPLYYGRIGGAFAFASELKAFAEIPDFAARIDRNSVAAYFRHNYVPAPHSILAGIRKLASGTVLTLDLTAGNLDGLEERYWYAPDAYREARQAGSRSSSFKAAADALEGILTDAVGLRMLADVPVGAFLSAGIDSTTVVALMQRQASTPVRTFTIGFQEKDFDEARYAREIALHLGTSHTEMYVSPAEAREVIPLLPQVFDEPFADSSQIPTYLVSRLARNQVTVVLSGDGGDEAFLGYGRYPAVHDAWKRIGWLPRSLRGRLRALLTGGGPSDLERWLWWVAPLVPQFGHTRRLGESLQKAAELLAVPNRECFYRAFVSHEKNPQRLVIGSVEPAGPMLDERCWVPGLSLVEHAGLIDVMTYLPDDILVKVDRSTMALGLEARAPLLDHRVLEFGWSLPTKWKLHRHRSKRVLRAVVERYVPPALMNRPKTGFGVPVRDWLRGPLRGWMTDLLAVDRIRREGILNPDIVERYVGEHLKGTQDWHARLWDLLMFEAWLAEYSDRWRMSS